MKVSTKGGNQRPDGTVPSADAMSVIEWATVNAVITIINERILRQGNIRHKINNKWSIPMKMCSTPELTNRESAFSQDGSSSTSPGLPLNWYNLLTFSIDTNVMTVVVLMPKPPKLMSAENLDEADSIG